MKARALALLLSLTAIVCLAGEQPRPPRKLIPPPDVNLPFMVTLPTLRHYGWTIVLQCAGEKPCTLSVNGSLQGAPPGGVVMVTSDTPGTFGGRIAVLTPYHAIGVFVRLSEDGYDVLKIESRGYKAQ